MSMEQAGKKLRNIWEKVGAYKYTLLILLLGVGLMLLPKETPLTEEAPVQQAQLQDDLEQRLEGFLSLLDGAGEVKVLLTLAEGTAYEYQSDLQETSEETRQQMQRETVLVERGSGQEEPVVIRSRYPVYRGAVVLCSGADSAVVRLDVVNAVSSVTGLGSDKISVIKMKEH